MGYDEKTCNDFLNSLSLPKFSLDAVHLLEAPITLEEIGQAIKSMNKGRSPGIDGLPPELYLAFWPQLRPYLLNMINASKL